MKKYITEYLHTEYVYLKK